MVSTGLQTEWDILLGRHLCHHSCIVGLVYVYNNCFPSVKIIFGSQTLFHFHFRSGPTNIVFTSSCFYRCCLFHSSIFFLALSLHQTQIPISLQFMAVSRTAEPNANRPTCTLDTCWIPVYSRLGSRHTKHIPVSCKLSCLLLQDAIQKPVASSRVNMPRSFLITNRRYKTDYTSYDDDEESYKENKPAIPAKARCAFFTSYAVQPDTCTTVLPTETLATWEPPSPSTSDSETEYTYFTVDATQAEGDVDSEGRVKFNFNELVEKAWGEINNGETHVCPDCGKHYSTSSNLARHRQTHRSVNDKKARKCPHCDKVYVSMPAYSMHVRTHNQGCECSFCGKRFSRPWLLQGHIRTHTGEKPFKCPQCGKAFADKSNLRAHIQTHSTEKPYVCGRCGKAFALKSYLYKHEESSCMRGQRYQRDN